MIFCRGCVKVTLKKNMWPGRYFGKYILPNPYLFFKKAQVISFTLKISWSKYLGPWRIKVRCLRDLKQKLKSEIQLKAEAKRCAHRGQWSYVNRERASG